LGHSGEGGMSYTVSKMGEDYVVIKANKPVELAGVGVLKFKTIFEAEEYIRYIAMAKKQYRGR
jgi:hypothetical protein